MIEVEKINGQKIFINPDLVKIIEVTPDTLVTFTDGGQLLLKSKPDEIVSKIIAYRKQVHLPEIKS